MRFWHRLTIALGHRSVRECQNWITSSEFTQWMAFYKLEPFGPLHSDEQFGMLCALVANMLRGSGTEMQFPEYFFPSLDPRTDAQKAKDAAIVAYKMSTIADLMKKGGRKHGGPEPDSG